MNILSSRLQKIPGRDAANGSPRLTRVVRVVVSGKKGVDRTRVVLSPGDRIVVHNEATGPLSVTPLDFFGTPFDQIVLQPGESSVALLVTGLWFQIALHVEGREFYPLDVYLAPNRVA
jgi:hypothetical protein